VIGPTTQPDLAALGLSDIAMMAMSNPELQPEQANTRAWRAAELPAMNMHATADGIARVFAALADNGELHSVRIVRPSSIAALAEVQSRRTDMLLGFDVHWARGVALNTTGVFGANPNAFGHTGWGGSFVFADVDAGISAAYTMNQMGPELVGDARAVALAQSIYAQ
jgi:CubicO group peptidase (beta-lactamase class C family)